MAFERTQRSKLRCIINLATYPSPNSPTDSGEEAILFWLTAAADRPCWASVVQILRVSRLTRMRTPRLLHGCCGSKVIGAGDGGRPSDQALCRASRRPPDRHQVRGACRGITESFGHGSRFAP